MTNAAIAEGKFQGALNTKEIIHNEDKGFCQINHNIDNKFFALSKQISDCCCELEKQGLKNTQTILNQLASDKQAELLAQLARCEKENDFHRWNNVVAANFRATTNGSNFNTGVQTQSTSNNSGQIVT